MGKIFISYRRADSAAMSRRLYGALAKHIGEKSLFRDVDTLTKGHDFRTGIERFIFESDVMLVLIGDQWLDIRDENTGERRLDNPADFVRIEVDMGLRHINTVLPVLINGATMPTVEDLPPTLSPLAYKNAISISDDNFEADFQELLKAIGIRQRSRLPLVAVVTVLALAVIIGILSLSGNGDTGDIAANSSNTPLSNEDIRATGRAEGIASLTVYPTDTPISAADIQATGRAEAQTEVAQDNATATINAQQTLTAAPSSTPIPEPTDVPTLVTLPTQTTEPTITPSPIPPTQTTELSNTSDALEQALERAWAGVESNDQWQAWYPEGFVQEFDGVEMVLVPTGCFMMGSGADEHEQCITAPFWIDKYEVSISQFEAFGVEHENTFYDEEYPYEDDLPVESITWSEARDFCETRDIRLPTVLEWEYTARGVDNWIYSWGNEFDGNKLNYCDANCAFDWKDTSFNDGFVNTAPVTSFTSGQSWVGANQMIGNVWEWVSSLYRAYPYSAAHETETSVGDDRVLRGGSWDVSDLNLLRATLSNYGDPNNDRGDDIGFRCARDID